MRPSAPPRAGVRVVIATPYELAGDLLAVSLQHRGITASAQCLSSESALSAIASDGDVLLRLVTLVDGAVDLSVLHDARRLRGTIGLVVLMTARDPRLLDIRIDSLPLGVRILSTREPGGLARLADTVESAARQPLAAQRRVPRIALTDEQVDALRSVAAGLSNDEIAERRSTSVGAARALITRTARALGLRTDTGPSQVRAELAAAYVRLVGGAQPG